MASRYETTTAASKPMVGQIQQGSTSQVTDTTSQQSSNTNQSSRQSTTTSNMSPQAEAALNLLIRQLMGGGTQQMGEDRARRLQETQAVQRQREGYSKEAAFTDAQGAMAQQMRLAMERSMPQLVRAAEGAGTSQNALRALLIQQQQQQAAEAASALGLRAASEYGGIATNLSSILERLTQPDNTAINALTNALNIAKGARTTSTTEGSSNSMTDTTGSSQSVVTGSAIQNTQPTYGAVPQYGTPSSGLLYSPPQQASSAVPQTGVGYTSNNSDQIYEALAGLTNRWQDMTF